MVMLLWRQGGGLIAGQVWRHPGHGDSKGLAGLVRGWATARLVVVKVQLERGRVGWVGMRRALRTFMGRLT